MLVVQVISKEDSNWWQARRVEALSNEPAGLIPSPELQECRAMTLAQDRAKQEHSGKYTSHAHRLNSFLELNCKKYRLL